jgi:hypothetical protein
MMSATTASFQVVEELLCISFFNARDRQVSMGDPMEKVFRCPNVLSRLIMCDSRDLTLHALL